MGTLQKTWWLPLCWVHNVRLIELRADCSLSVFRHLILLPPLNHNFLLKEDTFTKTNTNGKLGLDKK